MSTINTTDPMRDAQPVASRSSVSTDAVGVEVMNAALKVTNDASVAKAIVRIAMGALNVPCLSIFQSPETDDASEGPWRVEGSIYKGMAAEIVSAQGGVAQVWKGPRAMADAELMVRAVNAVLFPQAALRSAPPQQEARPVALEWSEAAPPTEDVCSYDHCFAETPVGRYQIEWKGWKEYDGRVVYRNGDPVDTKDDLAAAKAAAQSDFERRVLACLHPSPAPLADETLQVEVARLTQELNDEVVSSSGLALDLYRCVKRAEAAEAKLAALAQPSPEGRRAEEVEKCGCDGYYDDGCPRCEPAALSPETAT